jgi:hypothetical protein
LGVDGVERGEFVPGADPLKSFLSPEKNCLVNAPGSFVTEGVGGVAFEPGVMPANLLLDSEKKFCVNGPASVPGIAASVVAP